MKYLYLLPFLLFSTSCNNYYYIPNSQNVPLFKEKNEARLSVSGITGDDFGGVEVQAAYSPMDHLGIIGNFMHGGGGQAGFTDRNGKGSLGELGFGYFTSKSNFVFEVYGGGGGGYVKNTYNDGTYRGSSRFSVMRAFVQPNVGFSHDIVDVAFSTRLCYLNYNSLRTTDPGVMSPNEWIMIGNVAGNPDNFLIEPALMLTLGWRYVKVQAKTTYSVNLSDNGIPMKPMTFSMGLQFSFAERFFPHKDK